MGAAKRGRLEIVEYLLSKGANAEVVSNCGLNVLDYVILQGLYDISLIVYEAFPTISLKDALEYKDIGKKYKYRFVNYWMFLDTLNKKIRTENAPNFFNKQYARLEDPVIDPR